MVFTGLVWAGGGNCKELFLMICDISRVNSETEARMSEGPVSWHAQSVTRLSESKNYNFPATITQVFLSHTQLLLVFAAVQGKNICNGTRRWQWVTTEFFWPVGHISQKGTDTKLQLGFEQPKLLSQSFIAGENPGRTVCSIPGAQWRHNEMPGLKPRVPKLQSRNKTQDFKGGVGSQCNGLSRQRL